MKRHPIITLCVFLLCFASLIPVCAETITHDFTGDIASSPVTKFENDNKRAITADLVYNCAEGAVFGQYPASGVSARVRIIMTGSGNIVSTDRAVSDLYRVQITHLPASTLSAGVLGVYVSENGSDWTKITSNISYASGSVDARLPYRGEWYVRIKNEDGTDFYVSCIKYFYEHCNCFPVVTE